MYIIKTSTRDLPKQHSFIEHGEGQDLCFCPHCCGSSAVANFRLTGMLFVGTESVTVAGLEEIGILFNVTCHIYERET